MATAEIDIIAKLVVLDGKFDEVRDFSLVQ